MTNRKQCKPQAWICDIAAKQIAVVQKLNLSELNELNYASARVTEQEYNAKRKKRKQNQNKYPTV